MLYHIHTPSERRCFLIKLKITQAGTWLSGRKFLPCMFHILGSIANIMKGKE